MEMADEKHVNPKEQEEWSPERIKKFNPLQHGPGSVRSIESSVTDFQKQFEDGIISNKDQLSKASKAQILSYIASKKSGAPSIAFDLKKKKLQS